MVLGAIHGYGNIKDSFRSHVLIFPPLTMSISSRAKSSDKNIPMALPYPHLEKKDTLKRF